MENSWTTEKVFSPPNEADHPPNCNYSTHSPIVYTHLAFDTWGWLSHDTSCATLAPQNTVKRWHKILDYKFKRFSKVSSKKCRREKIIWISCFGIPLSAFLGDLVISKECNSINTEIFYWDSALEILDIHFSPCFWHDLHYENGTKQVIPFIGGRECPERGR